MRPSRTGRQGNEYKAARVGGRAGRASEAAELRKRRRGEELRKRRRGAARSQPTAEPLSPGLAAAVEALAAAEGEQRLAAARAVGEAVAGERAPLDALLAAGVVARLVPLLGAGELPDTRLAALHSLGNLASGAEEHAGRAVEALPAVVAAAARDGAPPEEREAVLWALGNFAGDFRDAAFAAGAGPAALAALAAPPSPEAARTAAWAVGNLVRGRGAPVAWFLGAGAVPLLAAAVARAAEDAALAAEAAGAGALMCAHSPEAARAWLEAGAARMVPPALEAAGPPAAPAMLDLLANAVHCCGGDGDGAAAAAVAAAPGVLAAAAACVRPGAGVPAQAAALWLVGRLCAGPDAAVDAVIAAGLLPELARHAEASPFRLRRDAAHALVNAAVHGPQYLRQVAALGVPERVAVPLLRGADPELAGASLRLLELTLRDVEGAPARLEEAGVIDALESVRNSEQRWLWEWAQRIVDEHYGEGEFDQEAAHAPANADELPPWRHGARFEF